MKILAIANINSQIMAVHIKTTEHFSKVIINNFSSILLRSLFCSRPGSKGKVSYVDFVNLKTEDEIWCKCIAATRSGSQ